MKTIKARMLAVLGLLFAVLAAIAGAGWHASSSAVAGLDTMFHDRVEPLADLKAASDLYGINIVDASHKVRNGNVDWNEGVRAVEAARVGIKAHWRDYSGTYMDATEKALADKAAGLMRAGDDIAADLLAAFQAKDKAALDRIVVERLYQAIDPITGAIGKLVDMQIGAARSGYAAASATDVTARWIMTASLSVGLAAFLFALWIVFGGVVRPVNAITRAMLAIAGGARGVAVPGSGRRDEIGSMAHAVEVFKQNAEEIERLNAERIDEDRRLARQRQAEMGQLADQFERAVGSVVNTVSTAAAQLQSAAQTLSAASEETTQQSNAVAAASEEAATNVQTVAAATEELSTSVDEIGRQVEHSSRIAARAVVEAEQTNLQVSGLAEAAEKIGGIVGLIYDIAGKTNLLALNATIEAARAGEAGRGFAVVASEVKLLADQTAKATSEISTQIKAIQGSTHSAAKAIGGIAQTIQDINSIASTIAAAVEQQGAATQEIARNVQQAAQGTTEVTSNITGVTRAAADSSAASNQVLSSASDLARQSATLRGEVNTFLGTIRAA